MIESELARVVECYGRRAIVQLTNAERWPAVMFGKRTEMVCGDQVRVGMGKASDELQVLEVLPRSSIFTRTDSRGRVETLAANVTLLAIVFAPEPAPDLYMVDRYLAGAAYSRLRTLIVLNKSDLSTDTDLLAEYRHAGYRTLALCAKQGSGIDEFRALVKGETFLLAGQSGVGNPR
jgi:ribosome biogenesis GTPase